MDTTMDKLHLVRTMPEAHTRLATVWYHAPVALNFVLI